MNIQLQPSTILQWRALVLDAKTQTGHSIDENLECYLVITLNEFTRECQLASRVVALEYLKALEYERNKGTKVLRHLGDHCLIISGLYPDHAKRKNVSLDYYIGMGRQAYNYIATTPTPEQFDANLFFRLSHHFTKLMEILQAMRNLNLSNTTREFFH